MADSSSKWYEDPTTVTSIYDLAISTGILYKYSPDFNEINAARTISIVATPSYIPREQYMLAQSVQLGFNTLIEAVSRKHEFLVEALGNVLKSDDFTRRLFDVYEKSRHDNIQTCTIGIHRCDYMINLSESRQLSIKQIEINTFACALMGLGPRITSFHEYVSSRYAGEKLKLPENKCLTCTSDALAMAWREFNNKDAIILIVVSSSYDKNLHDQRQLEFELWNRHYIKCIRKTLTEIYNEATVSPKRELLISGLVCAIIYYRAGYLPSEYPTEKEWQARLMLEKTTASCCPSIVYQLIGTKKMQQCLASSGVLEQFIEDSEMIRKMRSTFAGLYTLDKNSEGDKAIEMALSDPDKYVLKPQREGGGNNFYGNDIREKLEKIKSTDEREAYILMDRVYPPSQVGLVLKPKPPKLIMEPQLLVNEFGVYGIYIQKGDKILLNNSEGHCMRTKPVAIDEGAVSVGASSLDSPLLVTTEEFLTKLSQ